MAKTDKNDLGPSTNRFSFAGALNGIKAAFGMGGKHVISVPASGKASGTLIDTQVTELVLARKAQAQQGVEYWTRMRKSEAKLKMWKQDFKDELELKLRENFHPENYIRMTMMKHMSTNILQRIVQDLSLTYENPPRRFFKEDQAELVEAAQLETDPNAPPPPEGDPVPPPAGTDKTTSPPVAKDAPPDQSKTKPPAKRPGFVPFGKTQKPDAPVPPEQKPPIPGSGGATLNTGLPDVDALADLLSLEGAEHPKVDDVLKKLEEHSNLDMVMENVEMYARFLPCVWIRPMVEYDEVKVEVKTQTTTETKKNADTGQDETYQVQTQVESPPTENAPSGKLEYVIYTPDMADIVPSPSNPNKMDAFWYFSYELDEREDMKKFVNFWTDTYYIKLDEGWRVISVEDNPYGVIPVAEVKLGWNGTCYYVDGQGDDIYDGSLELCVLKTIQNARARDAGFKQLAISGADPKDIPADQVLGGPTPFYTGDAGSVTVLPLEPQLQQWTDMCTSRGIELSAKYGISAASYKAEGEPQSGFAKKLDMGKILSINRRGRKYFKKAEIDLYAVTRAVLEARPVPDIGVLPDKTLDIDFAEPSFDEDPKNQAETDAKRIKLGIDSIIDILKRDNPDLTEVELIKLAAKKKRINEAFIDKPASTLMDLLASGQAAAPGAPPGGGGPPGMHGGPPHGDPNAQ